MRWTRTAAGVKVQLPEDWTTEMLPCRDGRSCMVATWEGRGTVVVDFHLRGFHGGMHGVHSGVWRNVKGYAGRGWKENLVADAVAWLFEVKS